jgi:hypothetical protein
MQESGTTAHLLRIGKSEIETMVTIGNQIRLK